MAANDTIDSDENNNLLVLVEPSEEPKKTGIIGHSLLHRLLQDFDSPLSPNHGNGYENPMRSDMNLSQTVIRWFTRGGLTWGKFKFIRDRNGKTMKDLVVEWCPFLVYFELGTNGLDGDDQAITLAQGALSIAEELLKKGIKRVIIGGVIYREKKYSEFSREPEDFNRRVDEYNDFLKGCLIRKNPDGTFYNIRRDNRQVNPHIWFWEHKNMKNPKRQLRKKDGVHLTEDYGLRRLYNNVRLAVIKGLSTPI